ncbi:hypothetical protein SLA2020_318750 [Shorea laevis]
MKLRLPKCLIIFREYVVVGVVMVAMFGCLSSSKCDFEAIFNFGDSNSDTGGFWAAFPAQSGPFGMTYFKRPAGRASDGRLVIDFLAEALGLPFLSPYLQSIGPFSLAIQLNQMKEFKIKVDEVSSDKRGTTKLPSPAIFGKSLYTFYIGQNDFTSNLAAIGIGGVKQYLPQVVSQSLPPSRSYMA